MKNKKTATSNFQIHIIIITTVIIAIIIIFCIYRLMKNDSIKLLDKINNPTHILKTDSKITTTSTYSQTTKETHLIIPEEAKSEKAKSNEKIEDTAKNLEAINKADQLLYQKLNKNIFRFLNNDSTNKNVNHSQTKDQTFTIKRIGKVNQKGEQEVIITTKESSFSAMVNTLTGEILNTWNRTKKDEINPQPSDLNPNGVLKVKNK